MASISTDDLIYILKKWENARNAYYRPEVFTSDFENHPDTGLTSSAELAVEVARRTDSAFKMHCGSDTDYDKLRCFMVFMGDGGVHKGWEISWGGIPEEDFEEILAGIKGFKSRYATELRGFIQKRM